MAVRKQLQTKAIDDDDCLVELYYLNQMISAKSASRIPMPICWSHRTPPCSSFVCETDAAPQYSALALWVLHVLQPPSVNPFNRKSLIAIGIGSAGGFCGHSVGDCRL